MKKKILLFGALLLFLNVSSQFVKAVQFGEIGENVNDYIMDVEVNTNLHTYYIGTTTSDSLEDTNIPTGKLNVFGRVSNQAFITKYSNGSNQQEYVKTLRGSTNRGQITVDGSGALYFAVQYEDTVELDGQQLITQFSGYGETSMCMGKLDANGNLVWFKNVEGDVVEPKDLVLHNNNLYAVGKFEKEIYFDNGLQDYNGGAGYDGFIVTVDPATGVPSRLKTIDDGYPDFIQSHNGGVVVSGTFGDYGQNLPSVTFWDGTVLPVKLDANNNNGLNPANGFFISLTDTLGINYIQHIEGNTDKQDFIITGNKIMFSANNTDYFKMDNDSIDGKKHLLVQMDLATGNYITSTESSRHLGNLDYDPTTQKVYTIIAGGNNGAIAYEGVTLAGNPRISILITDTTGTLVDTIFRNGYSAVYNKDIAVYDDKMVIGGGLTGSASLSDTIVLEPNMTIDGYNIYEDGWFAIYNSSGGSGGTTSILEQETPMLKVYPNPFVDGINLSTRVEKIAIYNQNGQLVKEATHTKQLSLSHLPAGLYIIKAVSNQQTYQQRIIKR